MQTAAQEFGYTTTNFFANTATEALQALKKATTNDKVAVTKLLQSNSLINEEVANLVKTITAKNSEIKELCKSISEISCTIHTLISNSDNDNYRGHGGRGDCGKTKGHHGKCTRMQASSGLTCCDRPTMCDISVQYSALDFVNHIVHYQ
eukprot:12102617-Ditylum_brightwellii.AAC.1